MWKQQVLCSSDGAVQAIPPRNGDGLPSLTAGMAWAALNALGAHGMHMQPLTMVHESSWSHTIEYMFHITVLALPAPLFFFPGCS